MFQPLDKMYDNHTSKIREAISQLRRRLLEITNLIQDVVCFTSLFIFLIAFNLFFIFDWIGAEC